MADVKNVGAYHLANNPAIYEPTRSNTFRFIVTGLDNLITPGTKDSYINNAQEYIEYSVVSASLPQFTISPIEIRRGNSVMKAAGLPSYNEGSLVINDYVGADCKSILTAWQYLAYNPDTDKTGYMSDYKKDCYLYEYDPQWKVIRQWHMYGCWVSAVSQEEFSKESDGKRTLSATIQYDKAIMMLPDEE